LEYLPNELKFST
jgi:hypothetical protein